jgi:hypothetical protein
MPSSNGVYSLPPGYLAATGTTIQVSQHNPIFEAAGSPVAPSLIFLGNRACFDRLDAETAMAAPTPLPIVISSACFGLRITESANGQGRGRSGGY